MTKRKTKTKAIQAVLQNRSLQILKWSLSNMPRWLIRPVFRSLLFVAVFFLGRQRGICVANLKTVYEDSQSDAQYDKMFRECLYYMGNSMMDMLYYSRRPARFMKRVTIHNEQRLKAALETGKGVVAVTGHLGNFPLMFLALVQKGYKVNVVIRPMRDSNFSEFMHDLCDECQVNMIQTVPQKRFWKSTTGALKQNELLFILCDEVVPDDGGVEIEFFGTKVTRAVGPLLYHQRFGSPVLPIFIVKDEQGSFHVHVEKEIEIEPVEDKEKYYRENTTRISKVIEQFVKKYPVQWGGWLNKRWMSS